MKTPERLTVRRYDEVAALVMNRPQRRNAMDTAMLEGLIGGLGEQAADAEVGAVVVTGAGGVFSSGVDVSESAAGNRMRLFCRLYELVTTFPKPTVAAIAGHCIGGGAELAAGCDLRVGSPSASIRFPGAQFGIPVGSARLPLLVGMSHAKDLLLTSRTVDAEEAHRMGFINRLVAEEELEHTAVALASAMASNPGAAAQKRLLDEASGLTLRVLSENRGLLRWQRDTPPLG